MAVAPEPNGDVRDLYVLDADQTTPADGNCRVGPDSVACFEGGVEQWRSEGGYDWISYPLPPGELLYVPPYGMWIVHEGAATPVNESAAQYGTGTIPVSDVAELWSDPKPDSLTLGAAGLLAVLALGAVAVAFWRMRARARALA